MTKEKVPTTEIKDDAYRVIYDPATTTVAFQGTLRLRGMAEYSAIRQLLDEVAQMDSGMITLDLRELQFMNSAGINLLCVFVIEVREQATSQIVVRGSAEIPWQQRSLRNLEKLMSELQLDLAQSATTQIDP